MGYSPPSPELNSLKGELQELKSLLKEREQEDKFITAIREMKEAMIPKEADSGLKDEISILRTELQEQKHKGEMETLNNRLDRINDALKNKSVDHSYSDYFAAVNAEMIKQRGLSLQEAIKNKPALTLAKFVSEKVEKFPEFEVFENQDRVIENIPQEFVE